MQAGLPVIPSLKGRVKIIPTYIFPIYPDVSEGWSDGRVEKAA
jgi:hypothetical protein